MIRLLPAGLLALVVAGCTLSSSPDPEAIDESCDDNPIVKAFPETAAIGTAPLLWMECSPKEVEARYGQEDPETGDGEHCTIGIHDAHHVPPEASGVAEIGKTFEQAGELTLAMGKFNVGMLVESRKSYEQEPVLLQVRGGPDTLPVVGKTTIGDDYGIPVPAKGEEPGPDSLISVLKDRYLLEIECTRPLTGHDQARDLYMPYLNALDLGKLP